jgi:hypothetical protein
MTLTWQGAARADEVVDLGPLALIHPVLQRVHDARSGTREIRRTIRKKDAAVADCDRSHNDSRNQAVHRPERRPCFSSRE